MLASRTSSANGYVLSLKSYGGLHQNSTELENESAIELPSFYFCSCTARRPLRMLTLWRQNVSMHQPLSFSRGTFTTLVSAKLSTNQWKAWLCVPWYMVTSTKLPLQSYTDLCWFGFNSVSFKDDGNKMVLKPLLSLSEIGLSEDEEWILLVAWHQVMSSLWYHTAENN